MADIEIQIREKVSRPPTVEIGVAPGLAAFYNQWMAKASAALLAVLDTDPTVRQLDAIALVFDVEVDGG